MLPALLSNLYNLRLQLPLLGCQTYFLLQEVFASEQCVSQMSMDQKHTSLAPEQTLI